MQLVIKKILKIIKRMPTGNKSISVLPSPSFLSNHRPHLKLRFLKISL